MHRPGPGRRAVSAHYELSAMPDYAGSSERRGFLCEIPLHTSDISYFTVTRFSRRIFLQLFPLETVAPCPAGLFTSETLTRKYFKHLFKRAVDGARLSISSEDRGRRSAWSATYPSDSRRSRSPAGCSCWSRRATCSGRLSSASPCSAG